jgi:hypothetical protein
LPDPIDDGLGGGPGGEEFSHAFFLERLNVFIGDDPPPKMHMSLMPFSLRGGRLREKYSYGRLKEWRAVASTSLGQSRHFGSQMKARVNHLKTRIPQGAGDDFGPSIMTVEAGLTDEDSDFSFHIFLLFPPRCQGRVRVG